MKSLELFCGTKSFSKVADRYGYETITVELESRFNPTYCVDILDFDYKKIGGGIDVLWASPPCQAFSVAAIGKNWNKDYTPKHDRALLGLKLVEKTIEIINYFKPKYWFIENPRGMLRKLPVVAGLHRKTVTYCQYGDTRMKPTDIWTNFVEWQPKPACNNGDPCHISAPRGARTGTQGIKGAELRSVIPPALFEEIFNQIGDIQ